MRVEVVEHLPPHAVDRAVALVDDDTSNASGGNFGLYSTVTGSAPAARRRVLVESPRRVLFATQDRVDALDRRDAHARRVDVFDVRCWTLYSSVNFRRVSGTSNLSNSASSVARDWRDRRGTGSASRRRAGSADSEMFAAVNVLPEPVAIWISARGRSRATTPPGCDRRRLHLPQPRRSSSGSDCGRARKVGASGFSRICRIHSASVSGRWNENTRRLRASGS